MTWCTCGENDSCSTCMNIDYLLTKFPILKRMYVAPSQEKLVLQFVPMRNFNDANTLVDSVKLFKLCKLTPHISYKIMIGMTVFDYLFKNFQVLEVFPEFYNAVRFQLKYFIKTFTEFDNKSFNPFILWDIILNFEETKKTFGTWTVSQYYDHIIHDLIRKSHL